MKKLHLTIAFEKNHFTLHLRDGSSSVDSYRKDFARNLTDRLLTGIDILLKRNRLGLSSITLDANSLETQRKGVSGLIAHIVSIGVGIRHK